MDQKEKEEKTAVKANLDQMGRPVQLELLVLQDQRESRDDLEMLD